MIQPKSRNLDSFNQNIETLFAHLQDKLRKRTSKGDKQSLEKTFKVYQKLYSVHQLDPSYFDFHSKYISSKNIPDYIVPILYQDIQKYDTQFQSLDREEKRDSDIMKLSGCKYYTQIYKYIKYFGFIKEEDKLSFSECPKIQPINEDIQAKAKSMWDFDFEYSSSLSFEQIEKHYLKIEKMIAELIFQTSKFISAVMIFQYKSFVHVISLIRVKKSKGNTKFINVHSFRFDENSFPCEGSPQVTESNDFEDLLTITSPEPYLMEIEEKFEPSPIFDNLMYTFDYDPLN